MAEAPLARRPDSEPQGKCTEELKTSVPEEMHRDFTAMAALNGTVPAEHLRDVIAIYLYGEFGVARMKVSGASPGGERRQ